MTDFYEILKFKYFSGLLKSKNEGKIVVNNDPFNQKTRVKLFNIIPFLKIIEKNNKIYYRLFGFIPLLKISKK